MKIIIVDDDPVVLEVLSAALRADGHTVSACAHGVSALTTILRGNYDLAVCDVLMPDYDGFAVAKLLRDRAPALPVVMMSGQVDDEIRRKALESGAVALLDKPITPDDFRQVVLQARREHDRYSFGLIDSDTFHATRVQRELSQQGCPVVHWPSCAAFLDEPPEAEAIAVLLVELSSTGRRALQAVLTWGKAASVVLVGFHAKVDAFQDTALRSGFAMCVSKPIAAATLVNQARFLVS